MTAAPMPPPSAGRAEAQPAPVAARPGSTTDPLLLTTTRVSTFSGDRVLTAASGFWFSEGGRLFLVTSRHVLLDADSGHHPDRVELELHADARDLTRLAVISRRLYDDSGRAVWRQGRDSGGAIDVAVIPVDASALPEGTSWRCFTREHLLGELATLAVGHPLLIVGYPLGFHDTVHHLPVVRQAGVASAFGVRFQGQGRFLTDARTHRGSSGAPVVMHDPSAAAELPWRLLGIHSSRMDMASRDRIEDESLGLNVAWYADILLALLPKESVA